MGNDSGNVPFIYYNSYTSYITGTIVGIAIIIGIKILIKGLSGRILTGFNNTLNIIRSFNFISIFGVVNFNIAGIFSSLLLLLS